MSSLFIRMLVFAMESVQVDMDRACDTRGNYTALHFAVLGGHVDVVKVNVLLTVQCVRARVCLCLCVCACVHVSVHVYFSLLSPLFPLSHVFIGFVDGCVDTAHARTKHAAACQVGSQHGA